MILDKFLIGEKGQFFSPDIVIAIIVFIAVLFFFFNASSSALSYVDLLEEKKEAEEISHASLSAILALPGEPFSWEYASSIADVNSIGLSYEKNIIDENKLVSFKNYLDTNYLRVKELMGFGHYDFRFELVDELGGIIYFGGKVSPNLKLKFIYQRMVLFNNKQATFKGVISHAE
ncbi:MAG: hypothetical protein AABW59_01625 [archaeon]